MPAPGVTNLVVHQSDYVASNRYVSGSELATVRQRALEYTNPFTIEDTVIDEQWSRLHTDSRAPKSYYDYYYSGADMRIYIAELGDDAEFGDLPMNFMGFRISQEKTPIYGFWNYTYNAVLRGVRIIEGEFGITPPYPGYIRKVLAAAARKRVENYRNLRDQYPGSSQITADDANIDKWWTRNIDHAATIQGMNEYSSHPPFNLIVVFGVQDTSVEVSGLTQSFEPYGADSALYFDHNQRVVEGFNSGLPTRYILEACELKSMETQYGSNGEVVMERYSFFARDIVVANAPVSSVSAPPQDSVVDVPRGVER